MTADFKSHVLRRDEKGFLAIPFKRWLLAGVFGGMVYAFTSLPLPRYAMPLGIVTAVIALILTAERGGLPLWQRLMLRWRGQIILAAYQSPHSPAARLAEWFKLEVDEVAQLEGERLFAAPDVEPTGNFAEWVTLAVPSDPDGLVFIEAELEGVR